MEKIKGLFCSDAVSATGFARVAHSIIDNLPEEYEIHHLGINYFGDPHGYKHKIYPASLGGDVYGMGRIVNMITSLKPDFVFFLNDPWVITMYLREIDNAKLKEIPPIITYFPVDATEHSPAFYEKFDLVKRVCVYTEFAKKVVLASKSKNVTKDKIYIIPHGIADKTFYPINSTFAKQAIYPPNRTEEFLNSFIVLNGNRNQPRKRIDITMWAFREFQKDKPDVKLYLHMGVQDLGYNIADLAVRYGFDGKVVLSTTGNLIPHVTDEKLNLLYNATDVGINTSIGEGWGLVNWEHAATGKPQILPNNSVNKEIWGDCAKIIPTVMPQMIQGINTVGKVVNIKKFVAALNWAYDDWKNNESRELIKLGNKGYELTQKPEYRWSNIGMQFDKIIKDMIEEK